MLEGTVAVLETIEKEAAVIDSLLFSVQTLIPVLSPSSTHLSFITKVTLFPFEVAEPLQPLTDVKLQLNVISTVNES